MAEAVPAPVDRYRVAIYVVSALICAAVVFLLLGPRPSGVEGAMDVAHLPALNASINATAAALLVAGFAAVKAKRYTLHKWLMLSAFGTSALFLISYVTYHWFKSGPARYEGPGRGLYLVMLLTHIVLAAAVLPLALTTLAHALTGSFARHRWIAPKTLGIWLYVSITGVLIFWLAHG